MKLRVLCAAVVVVVSGCSAGAEPVEEPASSPSEAVVESPSASPDVVVDPMSAQVICQDVRLWDAYRQADLPQESGDMYVTASRAWRAALEEDAEPALREIAQAHMDDEHAAAEAMIPWCQENTVSAHEGDPW